MAPVELIAKSAAEIAESRSALMAGYVAERIAAGESAAEARAAGDLSDLRYFPGGRPAPGHRHFKVVNEGRTVGSLWLGPAPEAEAEGLDWVYFVEIDEEHRGRGLGREAMLAAEADAAANGAKELGLNVFGPNAVARSLYASLGYAEVAVVMRKSLAKGAPDRA